MEKNSNKITKEILFRLSQDDETSFSMLFIGVIIPMSIILPIRFFIHLRLPRILLRTYF